VTEAQKGMAFLLRKYRDPSACRLLGREFFQAGKALDHGTLILSLCASQKINK
jgi:hypothetical protein